MSGTAERGERCGQIDTICKQTHSTLIRHTLSAEIVSTTRLLMMLLLLQLRENGEQAVAEWQGKRIRVKESRPRHSSGAFTYTPKNRIDSQCGRCANGTSSETETVRLQPKDRRMARAGRSEDWQSATAPKTVSLVGKEK